MKFKEVNNFMKDFLKMAHAFERTNCDHLQREVY